ncbi:S9 family peptidase [Aidingimonas lacisalsi]|uniref:S9 family peptidase n=1 Tax=Aidingimonas lacisalsi TaxID=2604086 RepID=UPI001F00FD99|nr:prolyl oligopeptidase family serine peptidase [Aidingimonas lacisalsi]
MSSPNHPVASFRRVEDPHWLWLEARDDPMVRAFLDAANVQSDTWFTPLEPLAESLYQGHLARRDLAVTSLTTPLDHYTYWSETTADSDYPSWWRHPNEDYRQTCCFLDLDARASHRSFLEIGDMAISPDEQWLAWTEDTLGDEYFTLLIKRLPDGQPRALLDHIGPELIWAEDNRTLLFTRYDTTQRPDSVWRLTIDDAASHCILEEPDPEFWIGLGKTRSRQWLVVESASKDTTECHLIPAALPATPAFCFRQREPGVEYALEHRPGHFYVLNNRAAPHFRLDRAEEAHPDTWLPLIEHRSTHTLEGVDAFDWGLVLTERDHDEAQVRLRTIEFASDHSVTRDTLLPLPDTPCSQHLGETPHFQTRYLRLQEESFTQPLQWLEYGLDTGERRLLKRQAVHGNLQPDQLTARRLWATSPDGERIPVSIVARRDHLGQGPLPTLLYGYGAYGEALDPWFSIARLELLDRGVAFAVAHVRGGGERGEPWYLNGKLAHKENSFSDFLAAREALIDSELADSERIVAYGASAGGLLVGASLNLAPDAFCAAVLDVPFVDVLRTMDNPDLPLTTAEYTEWGNPSDPVVRQRIAAYSPLDNLVDRPYPSLFLQASWHDSRVPYWEAAKLYARLNDLQLARQSATPHPILLHTEMEAGHGGASGRFQAWRDNARQDAFILWALGLADISTS